MVMKKKNPQQQSNISAKMASSRTTGKTTAIISLIPVSCVNRVSRKAKDIMYNLFGASLSPLNFPVNNSVDETFENSRRVQNRTRRGKRIV